ncbi:hypothetical protein AVEN_80313-1 [Araneus ventricosus]|uniref:Uncharacterized protein n=1 Tax=Araneus ventricosus TaxID=182803 RepID=A0A4Y2IIU3_ARAVE|nr:hypothetical protein AVEN_80313-1 [Araneus ventricosus]
MERSITLIISGKVRQQHVVDCLLPWAWSGTCGDLSNLCIFVSHFAMTRQVEFYSSIQDAKKVQLCARTIHPSIYRSAFFISVRPDQDPGRERECKQHKPTHIGDI